MEGFLLINGYAFFVILVITIVFFSKERLKHTEDELYKNFLVANLFMSLSGLLLGFLVSPHVKVPKGMIIVFNKIYLISILGWICILTFYSLYISLKDKNKKNKYKKIFTIITYISVLLIIFLPTQVEISAQGAVATGLSVMFTYTMFGLGLIFQIICLLIDFKNVKNKKYVPLYLLILLAGIVLASMIINPTLNYLVNPCHIFIAFVMYFTIENPDVKMIEQLNIAKDVADKANSAKTDFLSSMSHEIRTPLNAIVGFSESLKDEDLTPKAQEEVDDIISASSTLLEIVNGILDISKIEANKLEIVNSEYDVYKILKDLINLTKARIGEKPIELKVNIDKTLPQVLYGDAVRFKQVILNLLTNAVKYTDKGSITFTVHSIFKEDVCRLIISIKDTGRGIKAENIDKLFTKFERLDEKNSTIEGTGLGLAITKKLVDLMNGSIVVKSTYQEGSDFIISIDQKIVKNPTLKVEEVKEENLNSYKGKKVLIVDDNLLNLKVAARLLQPYEMDITQVDNGEETINRIKNNEYYDLILLDDMMPHKSGSETLMELKQIPNFNIPVVVLTANAIEGMKDKYLNMGFDDYLAKPIAKEELKRVLQKYLDK